MGLFGNLFGGSNTMGHTSGGSGAGSSVGSTGLGGLVGTLALPGVGTIVGGLVGAFVDNIFNKPVHWHVYEAPNTYITEVSESTWNTLRSLAPQAQVDSGVTFRNLKLPKSVADAFRAQLSSGSNVSIQSGALQGTGALGTLGDGSPVGGSNTFLIAGVPWYFAVGGGLLLGKILKLF